MAVLQNLEGGTGCYLQCKRTLLSTAISQTSTAGSLHITGATVAITPLASGSSFICHWRWNGFVGASRDAGLVVTRDGSDFNVGDTGQQITQSLGSADDDQYINGNPIGASMDTVNVAGSTDGTAITFRGCINHENNNSSIWTNRTYNAGIDETMTTELIVWEVGGNIDA